MVILSKIYTKGGDKGKTSLGDGSRVDKTDKRVACYGTVDEANAVLGLVALHLDDGSMDHQKIRRIQNDLFDLGSDLCRPGKSGPSRISQQQIDRLEQEIDQMNENLEPLTSFILPGGSASASYLHLARTVVRRAEREAYHLLLDDKEVNELAVVYLNRLSDHLFVFSRYVNNGGKDDVLWQPGATRN